MSEKNCPASRAGGTGQPLEAVAGHRPLDHLATLARTERADAVDDEPLIDTSDKSTNVANLLRRLESRYGVKLKKKGGL